MALSTQPTPFVPAVTWKGQPVAWVARSPSGVAMLSFKQPALQLRLHSGTTDAGTVGWRYGPVIAGLERKRLVAAFNGGFRLSVGVGGFESFGRTAAPLGDGLGSVVTYIDGTTDIGSWHHEVPAPGRTVASVRQNLPLLIDHGTAASTLDCRSCWGATLGGVSDPARSALGIQANGHLIWAGAEHATVSTIADALLSAGVVRAVELDINPEWVAGYLYGHRGGAGPLDHRPGRAGPARHPGSVPRAMEPRLLHDRRDVTQSGRVSRARSEGRKEPTLSCGRARPSTARPRLPSAPGACSSRGTRSGAPRRSSRW